jgi:hypothetical protein
MYAPPLSPPWVQTEELPRPVTTVSGPPSGSEYVTDTLYESTRPQVRPDLHNVKSGRRAPTAQHARFGGPAIGTDHSGYRVARVQAGDAHVHAPAARHEAGVGALCEAAPLVGEYGKVFDAVPGRDQILAARRVMGAVPDGADEAV